MIAKGQLRPRLAGNTVGAVFAAFDAEQYLLANAFNRGFIKARLGQGEFEELKGLIFVARQGLNLTIEIVFTGAEAHAGGKVFEFGLKLLRIERARSFIKQS